MANENDEKTEGYIFQWKIENISHCWWLGKDLEINSPAFVADSLRHTKWSLTLYPNFEDKKIGIFLNRKKDCGGPDFIEVCYTFTLLCKTGCILKTGDLVINEFSKNSHSGIPNFIESYKVFVSERKLFSFEDTLNVQCQIWMGDEKPINSNHLFGTSAIKVKRRYFQWKIEEPDVIKNFKDYLIGFDVALNDGLDKLDVKMTSIDDSVKYISCNISVLYSDGRKKNCVIKTYFYTHISEILSFTIPLTDEVMEDHSRYFTNDVLSLDFEFVLTLVELYSDCCKTLTKLENQIVENGESQNVKALRNDLESLYNDSIFSDMELRTSTKVFRVHKCILSTRSPVFKRMFSADMMENINGYVDITDFEEETVQQMLLFLYTASVKDLQFDNADKLYKIADYYEILCLKRKCASFLTENLCPTNAFKLLDFALLYNDDDLSRDVQNFILGERKQIFHTPEWQDFMSNHLQIAADIMHRKLTKGKIQIPRNT